MIRYTSSVTIARPPEEVWPYVVEREKQALWSDVPMTPLTSGPLATGSRMSLSFGDGPMKASLTLEITDFEAAQRLGFKTVSQGGIQWTGEYRLAPAEGGTTLSQEGTLAFTGLWRLAEPVVGAEIRRNEIAELEKLKTVVEQAT
jgi:uncharacterized protein YndB with AHSA1/START domain